MKCEKNFLREIFEETNDFVGIVTKNMIRVVNYCLVLMFFILLCEKSNILIIENYTTKSFFSAFIVVVNIMFALNVVDLILGYKKEKANKIRIIACIIFTILGYLCGLFFCMMNINEFMKFNLYKVMFLYLQVIGITLFFKVVNYLYCYIKKK